MGQQYRTFRAFRHTLGESLIHKAMSLLICSILLSSMGCLSNDDDGFDWPDPTNFECSMAFEELKCTDYIQGTETPHHSVINPLNGEVWIVYLNGFVKSWDGEDLNWVADLSEIVNRCHMEQGLLGLELESNFENTKTVLVSFIEEGRCEGANQSDLILASLQLNEYGLLDLDSLTVLKRISQPYRNHNGGHLLNTGDNKFLWGIGDGGSAHDPLLNGQNSSNPLGSIYYFSYANNTIAPVMEDQGGDPFVLHYGVRNPWRFDLDPNGGLWIADVGQACWEEVNLVNLTERANLGWSDREGFHEFDQSGICENTDSDNIGEYVDPLLAYAHENGNCSITGGYWMDWGPDSLRGGYLYGDFCSGSMWVIREESGTWIEHYVGASGGMIVGFGQSGDGNLVVFHWMGDSVVIS